MDEEERALLDEAGRAGQNGRVGTGPGPGPLAPDSAPAPVQAQPGPQDAVDMEQDDDDLANVRIVKNYQRQDQRCDDDWMQSTHVVGYVHVKVWLLWLGHRMNNLKERFISLQQMCD